MGDPKYLIGKATIPHPYNGFPACLTVVFFPKPLGAKASDPDDPRILVELWQDGVSEGPAGSPQYMLELRPYMRHEFIENGVYRQLYEQEPPGWFERQCAKAHCEWFLPLVQQMAAGEPMPLETIQAAYRAHNDGKEMPAGRIGRPFI